MLGLASLCAAAMALSACGGDGSTTAARTAKVASTARASIDPAGNPCRRQVGALVKSMTALRSNLAVGLSYEQYAAEMHGVRAAYDKVPVAQLALDCLYATAAPAEKALNEYTDAVNAWGECLAEAGCTTASIEHALQHKWRIASRYLSEARSGD
jgi:hypothetical protein